jgi:hypothetical protein
MVKCVGTTFTVNVLVMELLFGSEMVIDCVPVEPK